MLREATVQYTGKRLPEVSAKQVRSAQGVADLLRAWGIDREPREVFAVLLLDVKHNVMAVHKVAMGSIDAIHVHPREVFRAAVMAGASALILAHNHPSGSLEASQEDKALTTRLTSAGEILGISILDHVIVTDQTYFSFMEHGLL